MEGGDKEVEMDGNEMESVRERLKEKKRIVVKIGSSSLTHRETGDMDYIRMEKLVRELSDIRNQGKEVILVTSGAIAAGKNAVNLRDIRVDSQTESLAVKQACAAVGQARLMMTYQKLFAEYNQVAAQILMTKNTIVDNLNRYNAHNTFSELLKMGAIPVVNENDTVATYEIGIGDNDTLSAIVAALVEADLLILLSDIDGLYTDDPRTNPDARFIEQVDRLTEEFMEMGKASTGSSIGTGGMNTKLTAAKIATSSNVDMVIANSRDIGVLHRILAAEKEGTLFVAHQDENFDLPYFVGSLHM
jgi:glutamate 5-kinase